MASPWTSAARSWLISFFHILTSRIPSLASSCDNQIPNHATSSTSHSGARPTRCPVVNDSITVDVLPPINDGAAPKLNTCGARSTTTAGSSQARTFDLSRHGPVHRIAALFQRQELGKEALEFAVLMTTGLLFNQYQRLTHLQASAIVIALSVGFTSTWIGLLLHGICPRVASSMEYIGVVTILVAFFGLASSFLPPSLVWACWLCCGLSFLPFLLCLVLPTAVEEARRAELRDEHAIFISSHGYMEEALGPFCIVAAYNNSPSQLSLSSCRRCREQIREITTQSHACMFRSVLKQTWRFIGIFIVIRPFEQHASTYLYHESRPELVVVGILQPQVLRLMRMAAQ